MFKIPMTILTLAGPLLVGCGVRLLVPGKSKGVVLAVVLATLIIPGKNLLDLAIHGSAGIQVGWGFAFLYSLVTGMIGLVLAELVIGRRERRAREKAWQAESQAPPPAKPDLR